ncbi:MAG TPA: hypothetical protein DCO80_03200 [Ornithinibacillus sp.]|nr:hypothetical protein [Ornithinibacillus sp.]
MCRFPRGELCLYSSYLTKYLLEIFEIRSYVVAGSSKWKYYPNFFQFKPEAKMREFHAWLVTEYGEIIDLTCDDFGGRTDSHLISGVRKGIQPPKTCWSKVLTDREYIAHDIGAKVFNIDKKVLDMLKEVATKLLNEI